MMKEKGFTLIELLGVITVFSILVIIAVPMILNQVNNKKEDISASGQELFFEAAEAYFSNSQLATGDIVCVKLQTLLDEGYIDEPVVDPYTKEEISLTYRVKIKKNLNDEEYSMATSTDSCVEY